jgi:prepilin-type N-terminal cleavage/methylation domain-containing protein/prepilin-type processing-associated H-X9-DG protein
MENVGAPVGGKKTMKKMGQGAFTLIELLVVIAVIALLMGILMPSLQKARNQAQGVACGAHVKNLGVAMRMYLDDYDGKTHSTPNQGLWDNAWEQPTVVTDYGPNDGNAYWGISYLPYAMNKKVFRCPSTIRNDDWPEKGWGALYQKYFRYCSYGLNGYVANKKIDHEFKVHSEVIVFQDHIEQKLDGIGSDMFCIGPGNSINLTQWRPGSSLVDGDWHGFDTVRECFPHSKASNTCWLDGHVSRIKESTGEDVPTYWYDGDRSRTTVN